MCCTFTKSEMTNTRIYSGEAKRDGKTVHVLAYQNTAISDTPNAMVIPLPTTTHVGQENVIDTRKFKNFLNEITEASQHRTRGFDRRSKSATLSFGVAGLAEVFDVGSYTVVLATHVKQIPEALTRVPANKRPQVSAAFLAGYGALYPDQPIAVCCWDGSIEAEPLMWWYEPRDASTLFVPTMDAHDGQAPRIGEKVNTDHIISVGAVGAELGNKVEYSQTIPDEVKSLLPKYVHGKKLASRLANGDCFVKVAALHEKEANLHTNGAMAVELTRGYGNFVDSKTVMNGWS